MKTLNVLSPHASKYGQAMIFRLIVWLIVGALFLSASALQGQESPHGFHGQVLGGRQPIAGAHIYLFAVSTNGYGSTPLSLLHGAGVLTDGDGNGYIAADSSGGFDISNLYSSYCPTGTSRIYLKAVGGDPGTGTNNPAAVLIVAPKTDCQSQPGAEAIIVNEATTIAAAWALAPYADVATGSFATSPQNTAGLASAFNYANEMVEGVFGHVRTTATNGLPIPYPTINTMADILAACVDAGVSSSSCQGLFVAATPPGGAVPTDVFQAALNIAQNPTQNVGTIFNLLTTDQPYTPVLNVAPLDWNIGFGTPTIVTIIPPSPSPVAADSIVTVVGHVDCNTNCGVVESRIDGLEWSLNPTDSNGNYSFWIEEPAGTHTIVSYYQGGGTFQPSVGTMTFQVAAPTTPTTTTILPIAPVLPGSLMAVTAHVNCSCAGGFVYFAHGQDFWGLVQVDNNGNAYAPPHVVDASGTVDAYFFGLGSYQASDSGPISYQVGGNPTIPTTITATITPRTILALHDWTTVTVSVSCGIGCVPDGDVDFKLDTNEWATVPLNQGAFTIGLGASPGLHNMVVYYRGDLTHMPGTSNPVSFMVLNDDQHSQMPLYSYSIDSYAANGNIQAYTDSVNGTWTNIGYDALNRLSAATQTPIGSTTPQSFCWNYDAFGNRLNQATSNLSFANAVGSPCQAQSTANVSNTFSNYTIDGTSSSADNGMNRLTGTNAGGVLTSISYDLAGNVSNDGTHQYLYDAEGRVCAVWSSGLSGGVQMTQYIYDANGTRVAKGTIMHWSCDTDNNGYTEIAGYVLGDGGEQETELDGSGNWVHTNVYAGGKMIATYDPTGLHFQLSDWLGTRRVQMDYAGNIEQSCTSNPFGDAPPCAGATEQFFTGKERDTESGLDYFGARYYGSSMGRFMSPDWAAEAEPVPYAKLDNPQSFNLYSYTFNNPLSNVDTDGHACSGVLGNTGSGFCTRADTYAGFDNQVHDKTRFFAAASAATQELADVAVPLFGRAGTSQSTRDFLENTGEALLKVNQQAVSQVSSGALSGSGAELDAKLVHIEQSAVQQGLDNLQSKDPGAYKTAISELNGLFNGKSSMTANLGAAIGGVILSTDGAFAKVLAGVRKSLGHDINFANQGDREAAGNALVQHVRQTGGCDVAGSRAHGC